MLVTITLGSRVVALGAYKLLIIGAILLVGYLLVSSQSWHPLTSHSVRRRDPRD